MSAGQAALDRMQTASFDSEDELLAACRRLDVRAFEQLYQEHARRLKSIALHLCGNRQDAEDAVQETFLKVYRSIGGFAAEASIGTWLCRVLINVCYDHGRRRQREKQASEEVACARGTHLPLRVELEEALARIHPRHRMVFLLFEVEGMRHGEIAAILEIPEGTSKAWLFEAKKELKRILTEGRR